MAYAATNPARRLSEADVQKPETVKFLHDLESAVAHYGRSTGFFGTEMGARGTAYLSAAVVYESIVVDNNNDPQKKAKLEFPLVAIYPKEGTLMSDHPACVLDAPWVTAETKEAATLYRTYLLSQTAQQQALQFGFRPSDPQIALGAPLTADNGVDPKQPQNTLAVPNAATIRAIRDLWKQAKRQVNLTLLLDVSGSMQGERITKAREGAVAFIDQLADTDNLTLITFSNGPTVVFENLAVGQNRDKIKNDINSIIANGGTALYDSIAFAIERMPKDPTRISALVVLTDGEDTASATYKDADTLMKRYGMKAEGTSDVSIFTIGYGNEADAQALQLIAQQGRGAFSKGSTADIRNVYLDISTFF
jgi:Ca-activated chloride channel family protein